jgi:hypothetical protein
VGQRTRVMERKLSKVETLPSSEAADLLQAEPAVTGDEDDVQD